MPGLHPTAKDEVQQDGDQVEQIDGKDGREAVGLFLIISFSFSYPVLIMRSNREAALFAWWRI
jgi:hypothetical protein